MQNWTTACPDWRARIVARQPIIPVGPLFPAEAAAAAAIFRDLRIVDAAGSPTFGEACLPWVFDFSDALFGSYNPETGRRLIREYLLMFAKKNAKSTTAAAIMLTALLRNWRQSGEFLILSPTVEIANNSFKPARDMVKADPELADLIQVQEHIRTLTHRMTGATLQVIAADSETVGGKKAIGVLVDELWLFGKKKNADHMLTEATGGLASRPEGFVIYLSTQSDEPPAGVFREKLAYARKVRDGEIEDPSFLPILYEFPEAMIASRAFRRPENFYIPNPNMGKSVDEDYLLHEYAKAQAAENSTRALQGFFAKFLNVEIDAAAGFNVWPGLPFWSRQSDPSLTLESLLERSEVIVAGIDGGGLDDLTGLCLLGREKDTKNWLCWAHAWCHASVLELRKAIAPRLMDFEADGDLTIVGDELGDTAEIVAIIETAKDLGLLAMVCVDPAKIGELVDALDDIGITQDGEDAGPETVNKLVGVGQGYKLQNAIITVERKLTNGTFRHSGSAMMNWCAGNLKIERLATAIRATKQTAGDAKVDPMFALFDAASGMALNPAALESVYEEKDLLVL